MAPKKKYCVFCGLDFSYSANGQKFCGDGCRFFANFYIQPTDYGFCWLVHTDKTKAGYGQLGSKGAKYYSHIYSFETFHGPIPKGNGIRGDLVRHKCHTPSCVNPEHLDTGSYTDNMQDAVRAGRTARGERNGMSKLLDEEVREIRKLWDSKAFSGRELAEQFEVSPAAISLIVTYKTYKHVKE